VLILLAWILWQLVKRMRRPPATAAARSGS